MFELIDGLYSPLPQIFYFFLALFPLVLIHELGHFILAKLNKVRVDEFGIGLDRLQQRRYIIYHSLNATAAVDIDEREPPDKEIIAEVNHVSVLKEDDCVAISMAVRVMSERNILAIEMDRHTL